MGHTIPSKTAYALSEDSNQRARLASLRCQSDAFDPWLPTKCPAKTDQKVWMPRLI